MGVRILYTHGDSTTSSYSTKILEVETTLAGQVKLVTLDCLFAKCKPHFDSIRAGIRQFPSNCRWPALSHVSCYEQQNSDADQCAFSHVDTSMTGLVVIAFRKRI